MSSYLSVTGILTHIHPAVGQDGQYGCTLNLTVSTYEQGDINFTLNGDTYVVDNTPLNPGDRVTIFYEGDSPAPLIYPPQYQAAAVASTEHYQYYLGEFYNNYVSTDGSLQITSSAPLNRILPNGQTFSGLIEGKLVLVEYTTSTRSIPAQVSPDRLIVFCYD